MTDEHKFQLPDHDREGMDWLLARWHAAKSGDGPPMILSRLRDPRALVSAVGLDADWFHLALTGVPKARTRVKFKEERSNEWSITKAHVDVIASRLVEEHDDALYVMQFDPALRCSAGCVGAAERMNSATGKSYTYLWMSCHCRCGGVRHAGLTTISRGTVIDYEGKRYLVSSVRAATRESLTTHSTQTENVTVMKW